MATDVSAPGLATPTFVRGAQDSVVTPDIYAAKNGKKPFTPVQDLADKLGMTKDEMMRGGKWATQALPMLQGLYNANKTTAYNRGTMLDRVANMSGGIGRLMKSMPVSNGNMILESIQNSGTMLMSGVKSYRQIMSGDFTPLGKLADLGNELTGSTFFTIEDPDSVAGMLVGTTKELMRYGIPNSVEGLKSRILSSGMQNYYAKEVLPNIIDSSAVRDLKELAGITSSKTLSMINSQAIQDFSDKYVAPVGQTYKDLQATYGDLSEAFSAVNPDWNAKVRQLPTGPDRVLDLTQVMGGSSDFRTVFSQGARAAAPGTVDKFYALATVFEKTSVSKEVGSKFPYTVVQKESEWPKVQADPRLYSQNIPDPRQLEAVALPPLR